MTDCFPETEGLDRLYNAMATVFCNAANDYGLKFEPLFIFV
jgi:hypothetical protein